MILGTKFHHRYHQRSGRCGRFSVPIHPSLGWHHAAENKKYGNLGGLAVMASPPLLATEPKGVTFHVSIYKYCFFFFRDRDRSEFDPLVNPRFSVGMCAAMAATLLVSSAHAVDVDGVITVDNAYGFAFGDVNGITTTSYYGGLRNTSAGEIANGAPVLFSGPTGPGFTNPGVGPELYDLPSLAPPDYMYLIAWSDDSSYQGAIGSFTIGSTSVGTLPNTGWEVFATGIDLDSTVASDTLTTDPADVQLINDQIAIANANAGNAGTSIGWVDENGMLPNGSLGLGELALVSTTTPEAVEGSFPLVPFKVFPATHVGCGTTKIQSTFPIPSEHLSAVVPTGTKNS